MAKNPFPFLPALFAIILLAPSPAAGDTVDYTASPVWDDLVVKEGDGFRLSAPSAWRDFDTTGSPLILFFEASGRILPVKRDGAPVIVTVFLESFPAKSLEAGKADVVTGYRQSPDRVFPRGFTHGEERITLKSGQVAYLVNTRFYRKSKGLNQSRFDLIAFSPKSRRIFMYTLSVQYADRSYGLEKSFQLKSIAHKLFGYFQLR